MKLSSLRRLSTALLTAFLAVGAFARNDQTWYNASADYNIHGGFFLHFGQEVDMCHSKLMDEESLLLAGYKFCPYFTLALGHRIVRERDDETDRLFTEHRPTLELRLAAPEFWMLRLDLRSRFEYRDKKHAQPYMRYRERFRLRTSWSATDFKISPYVSEEIFFSDKPGTSNSELLDALRSQVGLTFRPVPQNANLSCALYFMVLHEIDDGARDWTPLNIYGFNVAYSF
jgi:hypothetical protein